MSTKFYQNPSSGPVQVENVHCGREDDRRIGPKNTNLVEDVRYLLLVKFRQNPFNCFLEEAENVKS